MWERNIRCFEWQSVSLPVPACLCVAECIVVMSIARRNVSQCQYACKRVRIICCIQYSTHSRWAPETDIRLCMFGGSPCQPCIPSTSPCTAKCSFVSALCCYTATGAVFIHHMLNALIGMWNFRLYLACRRMQEEGAQGMAKRLAACFVS